MNRRRPGPHDGRGERIWTRDVVLATAVSMCVAFVFFLLTVVMAGYAGERLGASDGVAGAAVGLFVLGALLARPVAGPLVARLGTRPVLLGGLALYLLAGLAYLPADRVELLLLVRVVHGMGMGIAHTAVTTTVMTALPATRRAEGTGYFSAGSNVGAALGPLVALTLGRTAGHEAVFWLAAAVSALALLLALPVRGPGRMPPAAGSAWTPRRLVEVRVVPIASVMLLVGAAFAGVLTYLGPYADERGLTAAASLFFLVHAAAAVVSRPLAGRLHDRRGENVVLYPAFVSMAAGAVLLAVATTPTALLVAAACFGLGMGTLQSSAQAVAVSLVEPARVGVATSTFFLLLDLGTGAAPLVLGLVVAGVGYGPMYLGLAGLLLLAGLQYHLLHGRLARPPVTLTRSAVTTEAAPTAGREPLLAVRHD
ncbi:MFS transporter [Actinotalea sp. Marseille-Q4924]|uniref:MFS transporter n=1 Tax=Actinotalea sp. Marseille-Q4924 TaxID=2866571 RepID=UPI001CE4701F|nr:MFS transporter [Actinotalea sp. Marseille-Q4924]